MTKLLDVKPSSRDDKKYVATFCMCKGETKCCDKDRKKVHFGSKKSSTYLDHHDEKKKLAYIARHKVNENWSNPFSAGALSKFILWGKSTSLRENINHFKKKFNL
jgi:hypothetical protein